MRKTDFIFCVLSILLLNVSFPLLRARAQETTGLLKISMQKRLPSAEEKGSWYIANEIQEWNAKETAIIVCDMWDQHWCRGAAARVAEIAPFMNEVISIARKRGVLIVHAPSEVTAYYKNSPARKLGRRFRSKKAMRLISDEKLESEKDAVWPVDQSDEGCDCTPECTVGNPWTHQIDLITISDQDAISDSGAEIGGLFYEKGIKNVILMGVHTNMCVIGRSFGLRNMIRMGMNVVLMRDMTDTMYDSKQWPHVNHFSGNSLINEYIETYVCPTIVSTDFTGKKQFRFKEDTRPVVAFLTAENEYSSNLTLPAFAHDLLLTEGVNCEFAIGEPVETGGHRHNIENLQILEDADLAVFFIRRRGLEAGKMDRIRNYINDGKPVLGIRTASHAFDPRIVKGDNRASLDNLAKWPEFDHEVLGGNYNGHFNSKVGTTVVSVVPGMENHPVLKGVSLTDFTTPDGLYKNQSLHSDRAQVLLLGTITGQPAQPVLWVNYTGKNRVIYTSLGSIHDWKNPDFKHLMTNSVSYLLGPRKINRDKQFGSR